MHSDRLKEDKTEITELTESEVVEEEYSSTKDLAQETSAVKPDAQSQPVEYEQSSTLAATGSTSGKAASPELHTMSKWLDEDDTKTKVNNPQLIENSSSDRAAFLARISAGAVGKTKNISGRFAAASNKEKMTMLVILAFSAWLVPFVWQQASTIVVGLANVLSLFLIIATTILLQTIGLSLLLYPIAVVLLLSSLLAWLNSTTQANYAEVHKDGIYMKFRSQVRRKIAWTDISSVFLFRPQETMLPEKWLVGFGTSSLRPLTVQITAISDLSGQLVEMLKENCPWVSIDPELLELWEPAIADSHTDLWLKSLSNAPKENQLVPLFPGDKLKDDRYVILSRLGVGGQGTAYLVHDQQENVEVVLKETLFPVFVDEEVKKKARERFELEVNLLKRLNNDSVVKMRDSFTDEHRGYLVLDYIEGDSLRKLVKEKGALSEAEVREYAKQMASILHYLHELAPPVVHRDFTPENLILGKDGNLVLIDFNVARTMESSKTATVVGKHAYIPPEQFRGDADERSDVYALGATLYFLLTGEDPEPISQSHPKELTLNLSDEIDELIAETTHLDINKRTQSALEILKRLQDTEG